MTATLPIRVTVLDTWEEIRFSAPVSTLVTDIKRDALTKARVVGAPEKWLVKYRGAEVPEDGTTLEQAGIEPNGALIVLRRGRQPIR
ncbi:MAG TPA: hypothetical protein VJU15_16050 [Gemmatimonadales bacterium]|nr:hypothetical protein [Gemmatimonadales bacterium]